MDLTLRYLCSCFTTSQLVDVKGITKGKGFQGVMKRWNFRGGNATLWPYIVPCGKMCFLFAAKCRVQKCSVFSHDC